MPEIIKRYVIETFYEVGSEFHVAVDTPLTGHLNEAALQPGRCRYLESFILSQKECEGHFPQTTAIGSDTTSANAGEEYLLNCYFFCYSAGAQKKYAWAVRAAQAYSLRIIAIWRRLFTVARVHLRYSMILPEFRTSD